MLKREDENRQRLDVIYRNDDQLSAWSCLSIISVTFPAKTTLYLNTKFYSDSNPNPTANLLFSDNIDLLAIFIISLIANNNFRVLLSDIRALGIYGCQNMAN